MKIHIKKGEVWLVNGGGHEATEYIACFGKQSPRTIAAAQRVAQVEKVTAGLRPEFIPEMVDRAERLVGLLMTDRRPQDKLTVQLMELLRETVVSMRADRGMATSQLGLLEPAGLLMRKYAKEEITVSDNQVFVNDELLGEGPDIDSAMADAWLKSFGE